MIPGRQVGGLLGLLAGAPSLWYPLLCWRVTVEPWGRPLPCAILSAAERRVSPVHDRLRAREADALHSLAIVGVGSFDVEQVQPTRAPYT